MTVLWILNKYISNYKNEKYFWQFINNLNSQKKDELKIIFLSFSSEQKKYVKRNLISYNSSNYDINEEVNLDSLANNIELEYNFTFKQISYADKIQVSKNRLRENYLNEKETNDLSELISKFYFIKDVIIENKIDFIFSDTSPESEMELARYIGLKQNLPILKTSEGAALGNSVLIRQHEFGDEEWIKTKRSNNLNFDPKLFIEEFIEHKKLPYKPYGTLLNLKYSIFEKIKSVILEKKVLFQINYTAKKIFYKIEKKFKKRLYDNFNPDQNYFFHGFHLIDESTIIMRAQPYSNQLVLLEMLSRVLPYGYILYVREHPHWQERYSYKMLKKSKKFPNIKILSPNIDIHEIIKNSKGIITYNATTGIEALMYSKPVLCFSDNIYYKNHSAVIKNTNLYNLSSDLLSLINTEVDYNETIGFINSILNNSFDMLLGAFTFTSTKDAEEKAIKFIDYLYSSLQEINSNK